MAEFFDYFKVIMDYLKTNKWLLIWIFAGFSGAGYQTYEVGAKEKEKNQAIHEVAIAFQSIQTSDEIPPVKSPVVVEQCGTCLEEIKKLREEFH